MPALQILLATRNGAAFIQEQIDSYRAQPYRNWELLVSDDGSTDDTVKIIDQFAKQVPAASGAARAPDRVAKLRVEDRSATDARFLAWYQALVPVLTLAHGRKRRLRVTVG